MIIAVVSGKGGTGKTTIATNLAQSAARGETSQALKNIWLMDCDVEAPNAALFIHPQITDEINSTRLLPVIDAQQCDSCGKCVQVCTYNALAITGKQVLFFKELCHACGSCALSCPRGAISEEAETIGLLQSGHCGNLHFAQGMLQIGFSSAVPVIRDLKKWALPEDPDALVILDAAPGCTCPVVETLRGIDFALLVTEPTPFGLHDLKLVTELVKQELQLPCGVLINKSSQHDHIIDEFCESENIPILARLRHSQRIAEKYAEGHLLIDAFPEYQAVFEQLLMDIRALMQKAAS